jgi:Pyridoxamine 5'-phosphate oxidase
VATQPVSEKNLDGYGAPPVEWARVRNRLEERLSQGPGSGGPDRHTHWVATVRPDGRPHVMPVGAIWLEGSVYFTSGPGTRRAKNLADNPHCTITVATHDFDLVIEGEATKVTDDAVIERIAEVYAAGGWPATVGDGGLVAEYSAPSAGPPPWPVYEVTPTTIFALGTAEPYGAARFRF